MSRITSMTDGLTKEGSATKVWIVTGSASGLGRNIALAVLASGDRLVATARDPRRLEDLVQKYGDQIRTAPLDVADEDAACRAVQAAVDAFGRLDVVVNNAGYGDIAPFEQTNWGARASKDTPDLIPDYEASVGAVAGMLASHWGHETGDPGKVAQVVLRLAASDLCGHISSWAVTPFSTLARPRRPAQPMANAGERSVFQQTRAIRDYCLVCDSEIMT
jgi:hypothetical protein